MNPNKFTAHIVISGTSADIFDYTQDYANRLKWDTFLIEARLIDGAPHAGKGVKAWCVSKNGLGMETEYVSFNHPKVTAVKMTKGPYMFRDFAASWNFRELRKGETVVIFTYTFTLRFPYNIAGAFIRYIFIKNVRQRLLDLKARFEER